MSSIEPSTTLPAARRPARLTKLTAALGWLDDRLNPIVVKELRQAVSSKFVNTVLLLFLCLLYTSPSPRDA